MTLKTVKVLVAAFGFRLSYSPEYREYRLVHVSTTRKAVLAGEGYFTNDLDDAVYTAIGMYRQYYCHSHRISQESQFCR